MIAWIACFQAMAQPTLPPEKQWFPDAKYGTFIHWCIERVKSDDGANQSLEAYRASAMQGAKAFTATDYDPKAWAKMMKEWGSKYVVLTTKHHVGFALFDSPRSKFTAKKSSPAKRDVLTAYCNAMRAEGLKVGLYFSLPDRSHPDYFKLVLKADKKTIDTTKSDIKAWKRFTDDMLFEVSHLCRNYGKIDLFWFDGDWEHTAEQWRSFEMMDTLKKYQPWAVVNNRLRHKDLGDYSTPEMVIPLKAPANNTAWELCTTLGFNWNGPDAYRHLKDPEELVQILMHTAGLGGNLLLNVSPDQQGKISEEQQKKMFAVGEWVKTNQEAVYGTRAGLPTGLYGDPSTRKGNTLYLYVSPGKKGKLILKNISSAIASARIVGTSTMLEHSALRDYHEGQPNSKNWKYIHLPTNESALGLMIEVKWEGEELKIGQ